MPVPLEPVASGPADDAPGKEVTDDDGSVRNLARGAGFPSGSDEAIAEYDGELGLSLGPFPGRHFPLLSDLAQDQENELGRRLAAGGNGLSPARPVAAPATDQS